MVKYHVFNATYRSFILCQLYLEFLRHILQEKSAVRYCKEEAGLILAEISLFFILQMSDSDSNSETQKFKAKDLNKPSAHRKFRKENNLGPDQEAAHKISKNAIAQGANSQNFPFERRLELRNFANHPANFEVASKEENRGQIRAENNIAKNLKLKAESSHKDEERNMIRDKGTSFLNVLKEEGAPKDIYDVMRLASRGHRF